jgi:hypothetical protein
MLAHIGHLARGSDRAPRVALPELEPSDERSASNHEEHPV